MMSGAQAGRGVAAILQKGADPAQVRRDYIRYVDEGSRPFFRLVEGYYDHSFRELLLEAQGPLQVHRAVVSVLAGNVFPRQPFALRWRLRFFEFLIRWHRHFPFCPPKEPFSLLTGTSEPLAKAG